MGPARVLAPILTRAHPDLAAKYLLPCPGPAATGHELTDTVAALYRDGVDPNWDALYEPGARVRRRLPGYSFATTARFWTSVSTTVGVTTATEAADAQPPTTPSTDAPKAEDSTMEHLIALFREQAAVLAAVAHTGADISAPASTTPHADTATRERVSGEIAEGIRGEAARVSGFPAGSLRTAHTIVGDLGFDSIMVADLFSGLRRTFPELVIDPEWFSSSTTLGDLIDHVSTQLQPATSPAAAPTPNLRWRRRAPQPPPHSPARVPHLRLP